MPRGGARPNAGRPPGVRNRKTVEKLRALESGGILPLDYLLSVMRDPNAEFETRLDAAKSAAPYVHPRLAAIEHSGDMSVIRAEELTDQQRADIVAGRSEGAIGEASGEPGSSEIH